MEGHGVQQQQAVHAGSWDGSRAPKRQVVGIARTSVAGRGPQQIATAVVKGVSVHVCVCGGGGGKGNLDTYTRPPMGNSALGMVPIRTLELMFMTLEQGVKSTKKAGRTSVHSGCTTEAVAPEGAARTPGSAWRRGHRGAPL